MYKGFGLDTERFFLIGMEDIKTPFNIEFARSSRSRDGAPTVVPVEGYGASVQAVILALNEDIEIENAKDLLWRRETRNV